MSPQLLPSAPGTRFGFLGVLGLALVAAAAGAGAAEPIPSTALAGQFFNVLAQSRSSVVWVAPPTWKVERDTAAPIGATHAIELFAARNEFEPVQIVTHSSGAGVRRLSLGGAWSGPWAMPLGAQLHDVRYEGLGACPDGLPDRLDPVAFGADLSVCSGLNQVFWLTLRVPAGVPAGVYSNTITVAVADLSVTLPLRVTVFDMTLPDSLGFQAVVTWSFTGAPTNADQTKRWFYEHRLMPDLVTWPSSLGSVITWNDCSAFDDEGSMAADYSIRWLAHRYLAGVGFEGGAGFPTCLVQRPAAAGQPRPSMFCGQGLAGDPRGEHYGTEAYNQAWGAYLKALQDYCDPSTPAQQGGNPFGHDYLSRVLYWVMNEPQGAADYDLAAWLATVSRSFAPSLRLMISEEAKPEIFDNGAYPNDGYDVWLGYTPAYATAVGHALHRRAMHDEQSWWYQVPSLPLHFAHPSQASRPAIESRILTWLAWKYRVQGWFESGLESPILVVSNGVSTTSFTPTLRSELLREAMEDYEYFRLANAGMESSPFGVNPVDYFVDPVARSLTAYERDPTRLHWARLQLGRWLTGQPALAAPAETPVRPFGSYALNFQDPAGYPTNSPLVTGGKTWLKAGWAPYDSAARIGWLLPDTTPWRFAYGTAPSATNASVLEQTCVYDDFAGPNTFLLALEDGVYDVEITLGWPGRTSEGLATVNGIDVFGDRLANQPEVLSGNSSRTNRVSVRGGALYLEIGHTLGAEYWFLNSLVIAGVSPASPDGLDDLWQVQHFGSATNALAGPLADPDADGADNRAEFCFGTDPNSVPSKPAIRVEAAGQGGVLLRWPTRRGQAYWLETSPDLKAWSTLLTGQAATGETMELSLGEAELPAPSFFRVVVITPW